MNRRFSTEHPFFRIAVGLFSAAAYFLVNRMPAEALLLPVTALDRLIPFNRYMLIPYLLWCLWIPLWTVWFLRNDAVRGRKLYRQLMAGMVLCLAVCILWPNASAFRQELTGTDLMSSGVRLLRKIDTPMAACPSIQAMSLFLVWCAMRQSHHGEMTPTVKIYAAMIALLMLYAGLSLRQRGIIETAAGLAVGVLICLLSGLVSRRNRINRRETGTDRNQQESTGK